MGSLLEHFSNLNEVLLTDAKHLGTNIGKTPWHARDIIMQRLLRPLLPQSIRLGLGNILDIKDRQVGPIDVVGSWEAYPAFGEGLASIFLMDGAIFCLGVKQSWAAEELTQFGQTAQQIKTLERKNKVPLFVCAVGFETLSFQAMSDFLKTPVASALDGALAIGHYVIIRNLQGWYGDVQRIPFVSAQGAPEALRAFSYLLLQLSQMNLGLPFSLADYQHL